MGNMHVTDIHIHPEFKTYWSSNREGTRLSCWKKFRMPRLLRIFDMIVLGDVLASQATLRQMHRNRGMIALAGMISPEKGEITSDIFSSGNVHFKLESLARVLEFFGYRKTIDPDLVHRISQPGTYNFTLFKEIQEHLIKSARRGCRYNLLSRIADYNPRKLNMILTIEGGHNLQTETTGSNAGADLVSNLRDLKTSGNRYFFMSMAHLEQNLLCTHAYNIKIVNDNSFKPTGQGLFPHGSDVIREALDRRNSRILIDVKHMSLRARKDYYDMLANEYRNENIPIIMSHGGVTGVSWNNRRVVSCITQDNKWIEVKHHKPEGLDGTRFFPRSINLYDEEIKIIIDSNGLIGLNFDEKILGMKQRNMVKPVEYFSKDDCSCSDFIVSPQGYGPDETEDPVTLCETITAEIREMLEQYLCAVVSNPAQRRSFELRRLLAGIYRRFSDLLEARDQQENLMSVFNNGIKHLCNNILHIVEVYGTREAWKHICLGSDLDGMIDPLNISRNATQYRILAFALKQWLPRMAGTSPANYFITDIDKQVDDIMSGNARRFLENNFQ